jgi:hypothetical protein
LAEAYDLTRPARSAQMITEIIDLRESRPRRDAASAAHGESV